jgi:hypothetical protein
VLIERMECRIVLFFPRGKRNAFLDIFGKIPVGLITGLLNRPVCFNLTRDVIVQLANIFVYLLSFIEQCV